MQTAITNPTTRATMPMLNAYKYDQLNRLIESRSYESGLSANVWNPTGYNNAYFNAFTYCANGNILTQKRHKRDGTQIEDLAYRYHNAGGKLYRNRLYHVNDAIASSIDSTDIDDMGLFYANSDSINVNNNYVYDQEGRLVKDKQEEIEQIIWRVDGKVKEIIRPDTSSRKNLIFEYNSFGQRIAKHVYNAQTLMLEKSTYYILDAQGQQLSMYEYMVDTAEVKYYLAERNIYGSSRLGTAKDTINMFNPQLLPSYGVLGNRNYELTNHLGNVLTVITDHVTPLDEDNDEEVDGYQVGIAMTADYSPFGVQLDGRTFESDNYRYGFQAQESDDEVSGTGNSYTAEFWQYDSRLGRRWNTDPVVKHHESPYATFANNPIAFIDPNGKDTINVINKTGEMNRISGDGKDVFRIIDEAGKTLNTLEFDKGTIQYTWKYKNDSEDTDLPINVIQIKGNANTQKAFEFLATNTKVEWSFTATKRGSSQNGFLTTSHEKSTERGAVKLLNEKILIENYKIIQHTHNHPSNTPRPSGNGTNPKGFEPDGEWGDRGFAKWVDAKYESKYKNSDDFVPPIMYKIFLPATGRYIEYNKDGIVKPTNY